MDKSWSEHDVKMLDKLISVRGSLELQVIEVNYLILKIMQKYQFSESERDSVIKTGRY